MEHLGNKLKFSADEMETYGVDTDGDLTVTLKKDVREDTAKNYDTRWVADEGDSVEAPGFNEEDPEEFDPYAGQGDDLPEAYEGSEADTEQIDVTTLDQEPGSQTIEGRKKK